MSVLKKTILLFHINLSEILLIKIFKLIHSINYKIPQK